VPRLFGLRGGVFRRMHRKLAVIDGTRAFVGGINFAMDHLRCSGPMSKQDYAVEVAGPVVEDIRGFMRDAWQRPQVRRRWWRRGADEAGRSGGGGPVRTRFVVRDNHRHRTDIERQYRLGMRMARQQLIVANAYFFPSYRLLRDMARAARRGVEVRLILQGQPDVALAQWAARWLYDYLLRAGVRIFEYRERPLHGKVAVADGRWSTVGSSNLDPLSLSLNLEANLVIEDEAFGNELQASLGRLIAQHCREFKPQHVPRRTLPRAWIGNAVFHLLRHFPSWAGLLPGHRPRLAPLPETVAATAAETAET
jgi:cardiolipin synthase